MKEDLRYIVRRLASAKINSIALMVTVVLGIAVAVTMTNSIDSMLFRPPSGILRPDRVHRVYVMYEKRAGAPFDRGSASSFADFEALRDILSGRMNLAAYYTAEHSGRFENRSHDLLVAFVSPNYFAVLHPSPLIGTVFTGGSEDTSSSSSAIISYEFWRSTMGDRDPRGSQIVVNGVPFTVIGVMQPRFRGVSERSPNVWLPLLASPQVSGDRNRLLSPDESFLMLIARNPNAVSTQTIQSEIAGAVRAIDIAQPLPYWARRGEAGRLQDPEAAPADAERKAVRIAITAIAAVIFCLMCICVAYLLAAAAAARRSELAIRIAVGATRRRIARLLVTETMLMIVLSGCLGLLLSLWVGRLLYLPFGDQPLVVPDTRMFMLSILTLSVVGAIVAVSPWLSLSALEPAAELRRVSGFATRSSRLATSPVIAATALSAILLVFAGLFVKSFRNGSAEKLGFNPQNLIVVRANVAAVAESNPADVRGLVRGTEYFTNALARLRSAPEVASASVSTGEPFRSMTASPVTLPSNRGAEPPVLAMTESVGPDFFRALGIRILRGRTLTESDFRPLAITAVINQAMAKTLWPDEEAIGKCFVTGSRSDSPCIEVVGIAEDVRMMSVRSAAPNIYYVPLSAEAYPAKMSLFIRVTAEPSAMIKPLGDLLQSGSMLSEFRIQTLGDVIAPQVRPWRQGLFVFGCAGIGSLLMATAGLYGLLGGRLAGKARETGIRTALGATPSRLLLMELASGARIVGIGIVLGLVAAVILTRRAAALFFEVTLMDPALYFAVAGVLLAVGVAASFFPARRFAWSDPVVALRSY